MNEENAVKEKLESVFAYLKDAVKVTRRGRIFAEVPLEKFPEVFEYAIKHLGFASVTAITGLDETEAFAVIYHLNRLGSIIFNLKVRLPRENPQVSTVTAYFPSAEVYERELVDLLGIQVQGLPAGDRYPLADNWPKGVYPLRKDYKPAAAKTKSEVANE